MNKTHPLIYTPDPFQEGESYTCKKSLEYSRGNYFIAGQKYKIIYTSNMSRTYKVAGDNACLNFDFEKMADYFYRNDHEVNMARKEKIQSFLKEA
jgi:hypothetical protein